MKARLWLKSAALLSIAIGTGLVQTGRAAETETVPVAGQPLAANVTRLVEALEFLGASLPGGVKKSLSEAAQKLDGDRLQQLLDEHALFIVELNPESRVKVRRGPAMAVLQQGGYTPVIVKVVNLSTVTKELRITSAQAGQVYAGTSPLSAKRMQRESLREAEVKTANTNQFLDVEMFARPPMTANLSGLEAEYALALIHSRDAGKREATIAFDVGGTTQDLGFRAELPVLFDIRPAVRVKLRVRDTDGSPATASFIFRDAAGHVHPPQAKRLAPDFYFQPQIYRGDGDVAVLPPGKLTVEFTRGPEYRRLRREVTIPRAAKAELSFQLERWIEPARYGFYSGDHHIHGAGCAHYTSPTEGVTPEDMFKQVEGEGLNVGCVLTWGPCFTFQRRFFAPGMNQLSKPLTVMKYDLEISGFGSESLGHVCLLNLKDQTYPGSEGTKTNGWPSWTLPVMKWTKAQGGFAGYAHSASGLEINTPSDVKRLFQKYDADHDARL
ncbi:MAG TPA: CehA/McbA family metallohydrolase, partial [Candidatus Binatia bacterium]|nr:CehA/McbA family metallohydrolase [Candidatus Binatia bacterium]